MQQQGEDFWVQLGAFMLKEEPKISPIPPLVGVLLDKFEVVIHMPQGLLPLPVREHTIFLKEGRGPISVRPYRYAQAHKDEIEKLMVE